MDVDTLYLIEKYIIKKNQNGNLKPSDFNRVNNIAQNEYLAFLCGNMEGYQPGRPLPRAEFGNNRTARQRLTPVIKESSLTINGTTGIAPYPTDYLQTDAVYDATMNSIRYVPQQKLGTVLNSTLDPVATNPIYLIKSTGFRFYPVTQATATLSYVSKPTAINWGFTEDGNGRAVYDPATSVDPIWDDIAIMEIIVRSLAIIGVNLQLPAVMQYANQVKAVGQ